MTKKFQLNARLKSALNTLVVNATTMRSQVLAKLLDPRRDLDAECGYPDEIATTDLRKLYDREGVARRVVHFWPEESWAMNPDVHETEDPERETAFEKDWDAVLKERNVFHHLNKIDGISGIGRFGVLLLGIDDNKELKESVDGLDDQGKGSPGEASRKLMYLRAFAEDKIQIQAKEKDAKNPRFGQPTMYSVTFETIDFQGSTSSDKKDVHWSRIIHVADNRESSETLGVPRITPHYNRLYDIRKVAGSSGEMFYKGGFPGYALETHPDVSESDLDTDSLEENLANHFNGLQRYIAVIGMQVKSLAVQVANPTPHIDMNMKQIAFAMGVPWRKFVGSEQSQLASTQDDRTWNKRVAKRNEEYVSPMLLDPFVQRLIDVRIVSAPSEENGFSTTWPDLNTVTDLEKAEVAAKVTEALSKYVGGDVAQVIPPREYLTIIHHMEDEQVEQIMKAGIEFQEEVDEKLLEEEKRLGAQADPDDDNDLEE